ncbi:MAG: integrase [Alphaproteobacteria bacterium]|nr:integrase [Alphaproteobacteria bacterium]
MGGRGARILMRYVHRYTDRHGKLRYYYRREGRPRVALSGLPGSPEFMAAYAAASAAIDPPPALRGSPGTFSRLIAEYEQSVDFKRLKPSTQAVYRNMFDKFAAKHGHRLVGQMRREHVDQIIAQMAATPGAANSFLKRLKTLMVFAISRGWITSDPTYRMRAFASGEFHTWTEDEIARFEAHWPIGSRQRLAFALHLYTGQRRSDVHRMTWADYDGETIRVTQQKTGAKLEIPVHPDLKAILDATARKHVAILTTEYGRAFTVAGYGAWINGAIRASGLPLECKAHGLRKAAARRLADAGCSAFEIGSITGHKTLAEIERYTRAADQKRLSKSAMEKQARNRKG